MHDVERKAPLVPLADLDEAVPGVPAAGVGRFQDDFPAAVRPADGGGLVEENLAELRWSNSRPQK